MCSWPMGSRQTSGIVGGNSKAVAGDDEQPLVHHMVCTTADKLLISKRKVLFYDAVFRYNNTIGCGCSIQCSGQHQPLTSSATGPIWQTSRQYYVTCSKQRKSANAVGIHHTVPARTLKTCGQSPRFALCYTPQMCPSATKA